jgi:hypothetical protein
MATGGRLSVRRSERNSPRKLNLNQMCMNWQGAGFQLAAASADWKLAPRHDHARSRFHPSEPAALSRMRAHPLLALRAQKIWPRQIPERIREEQWQCTAASNNILAIKSVRRSFFRTRANVHTVRRVQATSESISGLRSPGTRSLLRGGLSWPTMLLSKPES